MTTFSTLLRYDYFPRRPTMSTFSTMLHYFFFFHAAALCLLFPFCSCAMATFSTQLCYVYFFPAAPLRLLSCADPGILDMGVQVNPTKKALTMFFSLVLSLFYRIKWLISKKTIDFQGSGGGPTFFQVRGSNFFQGGVLLLIRYRTPFNL